MSIINIYKGIARLIQDETKIKGTYCKKCNLPMDALACALGGKICFKCLKKEKGKIDGSNN